MEQKYNNLNANLHKQNNAGVIVYLHCLCEGSCRHQRLPPNHSDSPNLFTCTSLLKDTDLCLPSFGSFVSVSFLVSATSPSAFSALIPASSVIGYRGTRTLVPRLVSVTTRAVFVTSICLSVNSLLTVSIGFLSARVWCQINRLELFYASMYDQSFCNLIGTYWMLYCPPFIHTLTFINLMTESYFIICETIINCRYTSQLVSVCIFY